MKQRSAILILLLLATLALPRDALAQEEAPARLVPSGQRIVGDVATVTQNIRIEGDVAGDVTSWSGDITIAGHVGGDVVSYAGDVTVVRSGRVEGHVLAQGGQMRIEAGATVAGQALDGRAGAGTLASVVGFLTPDRRAPSGAGDLGRRVFGLALGMLVLAFCLLCVALWPRRTAVAGAVLRQLPAHTFGLGLLTTLALALWLPPLLALLAASLIGLPLLALVLLIVQVPYLYGLAALAQVAGRSLAGERGAASSARLSAIVTVTLALVLTLAFTTALPIGLALFYILASPGLGAAILSRGGLVAPALAREVSHPNRWNA